MEYSRREYLRTSSLTAVTGRAEVLSRRDGGEDGDLASILDDRAPTLLDRYDIPGATVAVVTDGDVSWTGAYGDADRETDRPMSPDTLCRPQSITKSLTAWGGMTLAEREEIGLDRSVREYITEAKLPDSDAWDEVTIRRVLSHTAGLPEGRYTNYSPDESVPSLEEAVHGKAGAPPARPVDPPGTTFRYSNPGYALLELLIEEVTDREYAEYMQTAVFDPPGMETATFDSAVALRSGLATSYERSGDGVVILTNSERSLRLIATLLGEWTDSRGLASVSLTRTYSRIETAGRATASVLGIAGVAAAWLLGRGIHAGTRPFAPLEEHSRPKRGIAASAAVVLLGLWWGVAYSVADLFVPRLADWVGGALSLVTILLFLTAVFPDMDNE